MKKFLNSPAGIWLAAIFISIALSAPSFGQTLDLSTLPKEQREAVLQAIANQQAPAPAPQANAKPPLVTVKQPEDKKELIEHAREWAGLGQAVGSGVVAAARELGIAANEFAVSDLGKITIAVLVWKYVGQELLGIFIGVPLLIGGLWYGWRMVRQAAWEKVTIEYQQVPVLWGMFNVSKMTKKVETVDKSQSSSQEWQQVFGYALMVVSFIAGLVFIA